MDRLGALCTHDRVRVEPPGEGPLSALGFVAKDVFDVAGHPCCAGNPDWLASHEPAAETTAPVARLLDAGATLIGKALCDELTYSITGRNAHYGTPQNPRAPGRLPGGSSSGSASAVAGGVAEIGLGTDTTGSIRTPAALCGLWGLRPTHASDHPAGVMPLAPSFDTVGALAADPHALRAACELLGEPPAGSPAWRRVAVPADAWEVADGAVREALEPRAAGLRDRLASGRDPLAPEGLGEWATAVRVLQAHEIWSVHSEWVERVQPRFGPGVGERFRAAREVTDDQAAEARRTCEELGRWVRELAGDETVIALPTCPTVAPRADVPEDELTEWRSRVMQLTSVANVSGLPQLAVPAGEVDGMPVSLSLIGPSGSELALIDLARSIA